MQTLRLLPLLAAALLVSTESQAQKQPSRLTAVLARTHQSAAPVAARSPQQTVSRPGRGVHYSWDLSTRAWARAATLETYLYDTRANLIQETFADSATAQPQRRSLYTYNAQNLNTQELLQDWVNGAWVNAGRYIISYDAQGNPTEEREQDWTNGAWVTVDGTQYQNTYTNNVLTEQVMRDWRNGAFRNSRRLLFTVANGQWSEVVGQGWDMGAWVNEERYLDIVWFDFAARKLASFRTQEWQGAWQNAYRSAYTHAANGSSVEVVEEATSPTTWALEARYTETFDNFGNHLVSRAESHQSGAWVRDYEERNLLTYTAGNEVRFLVHQRFDSFGSTPAFENQHRYNYSNFQRITLGAAPAALAAQAQLFPNPTTGTATVALPGTSEVPLDVLNALGQPVLQRTARPSAGQLTETLDLRALPAGVYTVRLHTPAGTVARRLVKQ
jgi:hypothetical protein